mgnify:CR=1 FL=1
MSTTTEWGTIATVIGIAIVTAVVATKYLRPVDPVKARYDRIDAECAKPTPDGRRREIAWFNKDGSYVVCPTR